MQLRFVAARGSSLNELHQTVPARRKAGLRRDVGVLHDLPEKVVHLLPRLIVLVPQEESPKVFVHILGEVPNAVKMCGAVPHGPRHHERC